MTLMKERKIVVLMQFGSHLYGTNNENSDTDYKGVFLPTTEEILLQKIPKCINLSTNRKNTKNSSTDIDTELYSLQYFIELAIKGETVALDMLHANHDMCTDVSDMWLDDIINFRSRFYTKNLKAFVGYARRQASKYGIKGSRLNDAKRVMDFLESNEPQDNESATKLGELWDLLPEGDHIHKHTDIERSNGERMYEVCGKKFGENVKLQYAYSVIKRFHDNYGDRAIQASRNEGIDWKAVSHALRAAYQVRDILVTNTITFPLKEAEYLKKVKEGKLDYLTEVAPKLEELMQMVEDLSVDSTLPEEVDRRYWDNLILQKHKEVVCETKF